jgi:hypothetical protein
MNGYLQLTLGLLLLSACVGYAMWVRVRVWRFRQDLFEIRDRLWDQMRSRGELSHPAHREARNAINALIRLAPALSLVSFLILLIGGGPVRNSHIDQTAPEQVHQALRQTVHRTLTLVIFESPLGLIAWLAMFVVHMHQAALARIDQAINRIVRSGQLQFYQDTNVAESR